MILKDIALVGLEPDVFSHTSDYFDLMLELCEKMIQEKKAYVDDTDPETMKEQREERQPSKNRTNCE